MRLLSYALSVVKRSFAVIRVFENLLKTVLDVFVLFGLRVYAPVNNTIFHVGTFSWVKVVLSNEDEVSYSRT